MVTWTVDVEYDWGGRTNGTIGLDEGIPRILGLFRKHRIKAIFFISTEILRTHRYLVKEISKSHEIGSHGHFHLTYNERWRAERDKEISETLLLATTGRVPHHYRAPHFGHLRDIGPYSDPANHVSLLKSSWFGGSVPPDSIIYLHPFDIVKGENPPSLFTAILYSHPEIAWERLNKWAKLYS